MATNHRNRVRIAGPALALLLGACASTTGLSGDTGVPPLALSAHAVLAPPHGNVERELIDLERSGDHPAVLLRQAWLHLGADRAERCVTFAERVLFRPDGPTPAEEALARFLRAEGREALGEARGAAFDRERARELAIDPVLVRRLAAEAEEAAEPPAAPEWALEMVPRRAWHPLAARPARLDDMGRIFRLTVHHSAILSRGRGRASARAAVQKIQRDHVVARNYGDIGYHFLIDPAGRVWKGRDLRWQGAHARGDHNVGNIGICVLGNFVRGAAGQDPSPEQVRALETLIARLREEHGIPLRQVKTHGEFVVTACPGGRLQTIVERIRAGRTAAGKPRPRRDTLAAGDS